MEQLTHSHTTRETTAEKDWARQALIDGLEREFGMPWNEIEFMKGEALSHEAEERYREELDFIGAYSENPEAVERAKRQAEELYGEVA